MYSWWYKKESTPLQESARESGGKKKKKASETTPGSSCEKGRKHDQVRGKKERGLGRSSEPAKVCKRGWEKLGRWLCEI